MHKSSSSMMFAHSPRDPHFAAPSNVSPPAPFVPPNVQRITQSSGAADDAVVMVKLTDEMMAALEQCQRSGKKIHIRINEHGGTIEIGDGAASSANNNTFRFQKQNLSDSTDTLIQAGGIVRNVGTYKTKYQIQATDKSFEETRKRAEKRAEVEKSRGTKEMKKGISSSRYMNSSSTPPNRIPTTLGTNASSSSRVSPSFAASMKASTSQMQTPKTTPNMLPAKPEMMKKSLRKYIMQLIVTQKYKNWQEVYAKLQADGLNEEKDMSCKVQDYVRDLSEMTTSSINLALRPGFLSEVDARWMFYNQDEKAMVRKLQAANSGARAAPNDSSSFAPMRKKGMERMTASSRSNNNAEKQEKQEKTPEKIPTPPNNQVCSAKKEEEEEIYNLVPGVKRKAHAPSSAAASLLPPQSDAPNEKRARRHDSASPPEDPMNNSMSLPPPPPPAPSAAPPPPSDHLMSHKMPMIPPIPGATRAEVATTMNGGGTSVNGGGSTASSRISSPASSLSSPSQPSYDWEKQFAEVKSLKDADSYVSMFNKEYPIYMKFYQKLRDVSMEFRELEKKFTSAMARKNNVSSGSASKEVASLEREIQTRYSAYEKDPEFLKARQKHTDLRCKLAVLKSRIMSWEQRQQS